MISFKNKKGLGRGLSSLIGEGKVSTSKNESISLRLNSVDNEEGVFLE